MTSKYILPKDHKAIFRLTLSQEAFAMAIAKNSTWAGFAANKREDGKWDVCIHTSSASLLKQLAVDNKENLSDVVLRVLSPAAKSA